MRIAVMGTGAVGGYFGAKLAAAGDDVVFIVRQRHLPALRHDGLRIESPTGDLHVRNGLFTDSPADAGMVDLVLFCVKSYDTTQAAAALAPMITKRTAILSLQNGIDNPDKIAGFWGTERILAGVVYIGAQMSAPGVIEHSSGGKIVLGPINGHAVDTAHIVELALTRASIPCVVSTDIEQVQWTKLLWNAPFCAISCLTRATVREIVESEALTNLTLDCMKEVQAAARIRAIDLNTELFDQTLEFSRGLGDFKPSMLQDLEAGKPLEYDALNGVIMRLLEQAGEQAPVNGVFHRTLSFLDKKLREEASR
ncbi:MAG TPA: 2-dehydropantoate 2-reductase [Candidatus Polarisedimenticolaceae bacterium]|nr:2-dehydropantoate 2-reductase [Candidatus Polarisedimenticolaceae bacterium]